ncbi:MAG: O-methyltransferase [Micromonosporaceae bacterium]|nr:O-methyltransferase [Micromonosporaceae bacterium]
MTEPSDQWTAVDEYIVEQLLPADPALTAAVQASAQAGLPPFSVTPNQGKLLHLLARVQGARSILEVGTLGGYSTIWLARALPPDGRLVTLEADPRHAEVARANIARAGLADLVDLRLGDALDTLAKLEADRDGPFDLVFIDADNRNNPHYVRSALRLAGPGTLIVVDNIARIRGVGVTAEGDSRVPGTREVFEILAAQPRVCATAIQTVGAKGYDGFAIALVTDGPAV